MFLSRFVDPPKWHFVLVCISIICDLIKQSVGKLFCKPNPYSAWWITFFCIKGSRIGRECSKLAFFLTYAKLQSEGLVRWLSRQWYLLLRLRTWVQFLEPTEWKERVDSHRLSSDLCVVAHIWPHTCMSACTHTRMCTHAQSK